jgi:hypothetical protein
VADGEQIPAGSGEFPREPLVLGAPPVAASAAGTGVADATTPAPVDPPPGS